MLPPASRLVAAPPPAATDLQRFWYSGSVMAAHDLPEPHCHVGPVGVEPGFQGRRMGGAAMGLLCDRFDQRAEVAWLETDKPENVRFYVALGFDVVEEAPMLSATFCFMRRAPR